VLFNYLFFTIIAFIFNLLLIVVEVVLVILTFYFTFIFVFQAFIDLFSIIIVNELIVLILFFVVITFIFSFITESSAFGFIFRRFIFGLLVMLVILHFLPMLPFVRLMLVLLPVFVSFFIFIERPLIIFFVFSFIDFNIGLFYSFGLRAIQIISISLFSVSKLLHSCSSIKIVFQPTNYQLTIAKVLSPAHLPTRQEQDLFAFFQAFFIIPLSNFPSFKHFVSFITTALELFWLSIMPFVFLLQFQLLFVLRYSVFQPFPALFFA
jgi:hypothetical protein